VIHLKTSRWSRKHFAPDALSLSLSKSIKWHILGVNFATQARLLKVAGEKSVLETFCFVLIFSLKLPFNIFWKVARLSW
jgi:hypothetical protein